MRSDNAVGLARGISDVHSEVRHFGLGPTVALASVGLGFEGPKTTTLLADVSFVVGGKHKTAFW